ncbi:MAG: DNA methyltransferase, partial [Candidatus Izemoplasmatales bacterium]|nr:DNA methyltransferase [Candidatus Izemoplasmatales bacterium]
MSALERNKVYLGNNFDVLKTFPDNSFDSIVTDPPYGLGKEPNAINVLTDWIQKGYHDIKGKGFMGKEWDAFVPQPNLWKECLRVLKPGGHLLSFAGTRTYDWVVMGLRLAGFEIRDQIAWVYGCLSEDTEIYTINGWEHYHKDISNSPVLCYNISGNSFEFHKPKRSFYYENKHTAYRIKSDFTNQVVSRNHRVLIEREGRMVFETAEQLAQEQKATIPFLESLPELSKAISDFYERTSNEKEVLFGMLKHNDRRKQQGEETKKDTVQDVWENVLPNIPKQKEAKNILFKNLCRKSKRLAETIFGKLKREKMSQKRNERRKESRLERWSDLFQKAWKLPFHKICSLSKRIFRNGTKGRLCYGTQVDYGTSFGETFDENGSGSSHQPRPKRQSNRELNVIPGQSPTQVIRGTTAEITETEYKGHVWCVEVETGAFVARRNGQIFITGNSGFPKSLNVSKAVESHILNGTSNKKDFSKLQGERLERGNWGITKNTKEHGFRDKDYTYETEQTDRLGKLKPQTEEAKQWQGWGSALKPALEPIVMARKPLDGTIASNVLKHGVGGLNIDGCRVG